MIHRFLGVVIAALALLGAAGQARAHDSRLVLLSLKASGGGAFEAAWRMPDTAGTALIAMSLGPQCTAKGSPVFDGTERRQAFTCSADPSTMQLRYSQFAPALALLLTAEWAPGESARATFSPGTTDLAIPPRESISSAFRSYAALGFEHILGGWDHLLFVLGLAVLAGSWRRLILTVTGFTVGHSISLCAGALGFISVRMPAIEALIAFSLVILAVELASERKASWSWRYPLLMSCGFGLLHGFGFAAALAAIGLPQTTLVPALLAFNIGVELGQLAFIAVLAVLWIGASRIGLAARINAPHLAAYVIGIPAAYWMIERVLSSA